MNRAELRQALDTAGVRANRYDLNGGLPDDAPALGSHGDRWEVYCSERGGKHSTVVHDTEEQACADLWERLSWDRENAARKRLLPPEE